MTGRGHDSRYWTTVVCVDRCCGGEPVGRLYNAYWPDVHLFSGTLRFLNEVETLLNETGQPQSFTAMRRFRAVGDDGGERASPWKIPRGAVATFSVRVLFRQGATWQGRVEWLEGKREEAFRSALELLMLMDSVFQTVEYTPETGTRFSALQSNAEV